MTLYRPAQAPAKAHLIRGLLALVAAVVAIVGCGGGVGVGGTGAYASGPITGFGSVIVNGIEFDDSRASVEDEDGVASSRGALRLGMVTEVDSGPIGGSAAAPTASATRIRYGSELLGPVTSVDASSLVVLGQNVQVTATTVFDASFANGLASVTVGSTVEVYGVFDAATNGYVATRIEPRSGAVFFKVRGPVQNVDGTARTFTIGTRTFSYAGLAAAQVPAGLTDGLIVRLRVDTTPVAGVWTVLAFADGMRRLPDLDRAELRGAITTFTSSTQFSVNGQPVDASAAEFPDGTAGLALGAQVDVRGPVVAGVLHATRVDIDDHGGPQGGFELKGAIETFAPTLQLFALRGVTVFYGGAAVEFDGGTVMSLDVGVKVEVRGVLSGDGTRLLATRIKFE